MLYMPLSPPAAYHSENKFLWNKLKNRGTGKPPDEPSVRSRSYLIFPLSAANPTVCFGTWGPIPHHGLMLTLTLLLIFRLVLGAWCSLPLE